ncbi:MAG: ATP-dependent DNA helicase RecG [Defluviitaleaceae bacterium]|nr:ATP-dependent DNA helicase RecG [Defluviitaleaceae bacterium]
MADVTNIKGVGAARAEVLKRLGIETVKDLINHLPRKYHDRSIITPVCDVEPGYFSIKAEIVDKPQVAIKHKLTVVTVTARDDTGLMTLQWFNRDYLKTALKPGKYTFSGEVTRFNGKLVMESPEYEAITGRELLGAARIVPIYPLTEGLSQKIMRKLLKDALDAFIDTDSCSYEILPDDVRRRHGLLPRRDALLNIHFPVSNEMFEKARRTLVFTELFSLQYQLLNIRGVIKKMPGIKFQATDHTDYTDFYDTLPFKFTSAQARVLNELNTDFSSGFAANRLIQGDVGSGKTAVAMAAMYVAAKNGYQSAMMAPTETLARQHYKGTNKVLGRLGITIALLCGSMSAKEKASVKERLALGEVDILIGTHALIVDNVRFNRLGLVITDEQHRFGVRQRGLLTDKGGEAGLFMPHCLVMTATPIPRTLALILYGDMDISIIDELPPGRKSIRTDAVNSSYRPRIFAFIKKQAEESRRVFIVCPMIEDNDAGMKAVKSYAEEARSALGLGVAVMHGKLTQKEKDAVMESFINGDLPVMIATTVIEVGIDVPAATVMLVENAERFGLAQLHQLRGRVGRGDAQSYCILISDSKSDVTKKRMSAMTATGDGFALSDLDLEIRGPGEFFGARQHGLPELRIANLYKDRDILAEAQKEAQRIIESGEIEINQENLKIQVII